MKNLTFYPAAFTMLVMLCACNSADNNIDTPIQKRGDTFQRLLKNEDYSIIYTRTDEVSNSLHVHPDLISKRSVHLNKEETKVVTECLETLVLKNETLPYAPCSWSWDMEYWITSNGELAFSIGPKGETLLGLVEPHFWYRARQKLTNAMKKARKKARESAAW